MAQRHRIGRRIPMAVAGTGLIAAMLPASVAWGAGFAIKEDSASELGTAFAGAGSAAATPSTVFTNPAGMTQLPGLQVELGSTVIDPSLTFKGSATDAFGRPISGASTANGGHAALVPNGYITYKATENLSIGLALTSPFGLSTYYGPDFVGRYQADKTQLTDININPAIAYRLAPWVSIGVGISADYVIGEFANATNSQTIAASVLGTPLPLPDGLARVRGDSWAVGYNFGALFKPTANDNIGVTYRSRIVHDISGTATFNAPFPLSLSPAFRTGPASAKLVLPDSATLSFTHIFSPRWTGYMDLTWTDWSLFKSLQINRSDGTVLSTIPEDYHNTITVAIGASYAVTSKLTLRAGTAFDQSPDSSDTFNASAPDADRYWLSIGGSYQVLPNTAIDVGYAHIFLNSASIHQTSSTGDVLTGSYDSHVDLFSASTRLQF